MDERARVRLTKRYIDSLAPQVEDYFAWDRDIPGFGVCVRKSGRKSYILKYRVGSGRGAKVRKPTIGVHGAITVDEARRVAKDWLAEARLGGDPSGARRAEARATDVSELCQKYLVEHAYVYKKPSSVRHDERMIEKVVKPSLGRFAITAVSRDEIAKLHTRLMPKPYEANRVLSLLSKMFNLAEVWGMRPDGSNPCRHVRKYKEEKRRRFLSETEFARLGAALELASAGELRTSRGARISEFAIAAVRLLLLTGARRGEILGLRWFEVNFDDSRIELAESKTGAKFIYLPPAAIEVLRNLPRLQDNPHVIVGGKVGSPLVNIKDPWDAIRREADLNDIRLHDLRHSFASLGASGGMSLPILGALLGHQEPATTARYAHLSDDPLRQAANAIGSRISEAMQKS